MPQKRGAAHMQSIHLGPALSSALQPHGGDSEVEDGSAEAADVLRVDFAEVAEVVVPRKVPRRLLHGRQVQVPPLHYEVLVLAVHRAEPGKHTRHNMLSCPAIYGSQAEHFQIALKYRCRDFPSGESVTSPIVAFLQYQLSYQSAHGCAQSDGSTSYILHFKTTRTSRQAYMTQCKVRAGMLQVTTPGAEAFRRERPAQHAYIVRQRAIEGDCVVHLLIHVKIWLTCLCSRPQPQRHHLKKLASVHPPYMPESALHSC